MRKQYKVGIIIIMESLMMILFYGPNERMSIFWFIIVFLLIVNIAYIYTLYFYEDKRKVLGEINLTTFIYGVITGLTIIFSIFQFNYVIMPYQYFKSDVFWSNYEYKEFYDEVRIEYYTRGYLEYGEVYKVSYDKDEIKEFLDFFRGLELLPDSAYEDLGYPDVHMNWDDNDIHVMIRNMDSDDSDRGHYVFSIDLKGNSNYVYYGRVDDTVKIYEVPEGLREFIIFNLLKE